MQKYAGTTVALGHFVSKSLRDNLDFAGNVIVSIYFLVYK